MSWVDEFLDFERHSPSPQHAFARVQKILNRGKFKPAGNGEWPKDKGYALLGRAIVAYNVNGKRPAVVFVARPDRPCFIVRADACRKDGVYDFVNVHRGTSTDTAAWCARDLRAVGMTKDGTLYDSERAVCCVPVKSHGFATEFVMDAEREYMPLVGVGVSLEEAVGRDPAGLRLIDAQPAQLVGADQQLLCGTGVGEVAGAYVAARAFSKCAVREGECSFLVVYDGVEGFDVEGALRDVAEKVLGQRDGALSDALCVDFSAVPAFHPNFAQNSDEQNCARIGSGIAMVDGAELETRVAVERAAGKLGIPLQKFIEKQLPDKQKAERELPFVAKMGMRYVNVGLPTLGMNGARQTVAVRDIDSLVRFAEEVASNSGDHRITM